MRRRLRGRIPLVHAALQLVPRDELLPADQLFERGKPVLVIARSVVRRPVRGRGREFGGQGVGPFATLIGCYLAAVTTISTSVSLLPSSTATQARVGGFLRSIQASHASFIADFCAMSEM